MPNSTSGRGKLPWGLRIAFCGGKKARATTLAQRCFASIPFLSADVSDFLHLLVQEMSVLNGDYSGHGNSYESLPAAHSWVYLHDFNRVYLYKLSAILRFWRRSKLPWNSTRTIKLYIMHFVLSWTFRFGAQNESLSHHHHPPSRKIIRVLFSKQENNQKFKRIALANCSKPPA